MNRQKRVEQLLAEPHDSLALALVEIHEVLYPPEDPQAEWSCEMLESIERLPVGAHQGR